MAIIVEDGSIVASANSYVTREDYVSYAGDRGITIADEFDRDFELTKAFDFISFQESQLNGSKTSRDQTGAFPRSGVTVDGWTWSENEIPRAVILLQLSVALDINSGIDPYNPEPSEAPTLKSFKVDGVYSEEYFTNENPSKLSKNSSTDALLNSLKKNSGLQFVRN